MKFGARCVIERRPKSFSDSAIGLRASSENKDGKEDFAAMAARAQAEAEKAAQRAAAVRAAKAEKVEAERAALKAAALRKFLKNEKLSESATLSRESEDSEDTEDTSAESKADAKRRYDRKFFEVVLEKPMGLVLEENHESLRGVFVADIVSGSNAAKTDQELVGCQLVSFWGGAEEPAEGGFDAMGKELDEIIEAIGAAPSPVTAKLFSGSSSSLYGGWTAEAKGKEVTVSTNRPNKQLIDRIRSGL